MSECALHGCLDYIKYCSNKKQHVLPGNDVFVVHVFQYKTKFLVEIILAVRINKPVES